ncbi:hypothetical protein KC342_g17803 [Hortaea werneckii]|nr:hypothetical protein KC342_g17803 [Hortaea werneckii]KAI7374714.1 hypothetical protein KC328_g15865 [Hortaea werneckii]
MLLSTPSKSIGCSKNFSNARMVATLLDRRREHLVGSDPIQRCPDAEGEYSLPEESGERCRLAQRGTGGQRGRRGVSEAQRAGARQAKAECSARGREQNGERRRHADDRSCRRRNYSGSEIDPLDDLIGPAPPPKTLPRGHGANTTPSTSNIDTRFRPDYDPKADVHDSTPEHEGERDDWDMALETLRDRAKWKEAGAERQKVARFTDQEVKRWKYGGREKDERDFKWRKKEEGRE